MQSTSKQERSNILKLQRRKPVPVVPKKSTCSAKKKGVTLVTLVQMHKIQSNYIQKMHL